MGKHKKKSKHHKEKKSKHKKHRKQSTSTSGSSGSDSEWVEKASQSSSEDETTKNPEKSHEDWMNLPTKFLTTSNEERRRERDRVKQDEKDKQKYNPRECSRELNPYWKDGGDGLPKFKKPSEEENTQSYKSTSSRHSSLNISSSSSNSQRWRKKAEIIPKVSTLKASSTSTSITDDQPVLTDKELNQLAAKLVKAEILGNKEQIAELKATLEKARNNSHQSRQKEDDVVLLTHTDSKGSSQPVKLSSDYDKSTSDNKRRKKNVETHADGKRVRYFANDDKYSLQQMFEEEKYGSNDSQNAEFVKLAGRIRKNDDMDDIFTDNIRKEDADSKTDEKNRQRAISEANKVSKSLDNCSKCIQSEQMLKNLMISMGETVYLSLPPHEPLTEGHCFIVPIRHVPCATQLDENEWSEILNIRKALVKLFGSKDEDPIFIETAMRLHKFPHMYIECIPLPKEEGDMAPIYFKKAIDESETEWAQNKKLVSLKGRDVRRAVPKGLPYFSVSFGMEEGYAHVIEDENAFAHNFAHEIVGGMLDLHHSKWRKPRRQNFEEQNKRMLEFSNNWKDFDCTTQM